MHKKLARLAFLGVLCALSGAALASEAALNVVDPDAAGVSAPYLIPTSRVSPSYPPAAMQARYDAVVLLRATVLADGTVGSVDVLDTTREKLGFEKAALRAVKQWRFEPAQQEGANVASYTWIRMRFNPPQANGGGFIAADFPRSSGTALPTTGSAPTLASLAAASDVNRTAVSDSQAARFAKYGKPPCLEGCLYNREDLIPPSTYGFSIAAGD